MSYHVQPQVAQLDVQFAGPLEKNSVVENLNDLITLRNNYPQRRVWVLSEQIEYYLVSGTGSNLQDWKPVAAKTTIEDYDSNKTYQIGDVVSSRFEGKLYKAIATVPRDKRPGRNPRLWQPITGDIQTYVDTITSENSLPFEVQVNQANPMFRAFMTETLEDGRAVEFEIDYHVEKKTNQDMSDPDIDGTDDLTDILDDSLFSDTVYVFRFYADGKEMEQLPENTTITIVTK